MMIKHQISNIKYQIVLLLVLAATVASCRPKGILHSWEMRDVLVDLHKTDAMLQLAGMKNTNQAEKNIYYAQVLERHGITQAEFDSSLVWYTAHPQLFDKIYPKVMASLEAEEERFIALHDAELNLKPANASSAENRPMTRAEVDSVVWVIQHGYPTRWTPRPKPLILLP